MYLNVTQTFRIVISPLRPAPTRCVWCLLLLRHLISERTSSLLVRLTLYKSPADDRYYIQQQDDFFQPEVRILVFILLSFHPITPIVEMNSCSLRDCAHPDDRPFPRTSST